LDMAEFGNKMSDWRACRRCTACGTDFRHGFGRVAAKIPESMNGRSSWVVSLDLLLHFSVPSCCFAFVRISHLISCLLELVLAISLSHRLLFLDHHSPGALSAKSITLSRHYSNIH
jgi:hypothetical protein